MAGNNIRRDRRWWLYHQRQWHCVCNLQPVWHSKVQRGRHGNVMFVLPNGGFWVDGNVTSRQQRIHGVL